MKRTALWVFFHPLRALAEFNAFKLIADEQHGNEVESYEIALTERGNDLARQRNRILELDALASDRLKQLLESADRVHELEAQCTTLENRKVELEVALEKLEELTTAQATNLRRCFTAVKDGMEYFEQQWSNRTRRTRSKVVLLNNKDCKVVYDLLREAYLATRGLDGPDVPTGDVAEEPF